MEDTVQEARMREFFRESGLALEATAELGVFTVVPISPEHRAIFPGLTVFWSGGQGLHSPPTYWRFSLRRDESGEDEVFEARSLTAATALLRKVLVAVAHIQAKAVLEEVAATGNPKAGYFLVARVPVDAQCDALRVSTSARSASAAVELLVAALAALATSDSAVQEVKAKGNATERAVMAALLATPLDLKMPPELANNEEPDYAALIGAPLAEA